MPINAEQSFFISGINPLSSIQNDVASSIISSSCNRFKREFSQDNGFDNIFLKCLFDSSIVLMSFFWDYLDNAIAEFVPVTDYYKFHKRDKKEWWKIVLTVVLNLLLTAVIGLPLLVIGFPIWLSLQSFRRPYRRINKIKNHSVRRDSECQENESFEGQNDDFGKFTVVSNNLCFLTEIASRVNNLSHNKKRASRIGDLLVNDCISDETNMPDPRIKLTMPSKIDFLCLQEVFQRKSAKKLISKIKHNFPYIIWDIGHMFGSNCGKSRGFIALENSGLLFASKHPIEKVVYKQYKTATMGDRLAGKGVLLCIVNFRGRLGIIATTHLQAQEGETCQQLRRDQMKFVHGEIEKIKIEHKDLIHFVIICGDLNFDLKLKRDKIEADSYEEEFLDYKDCHVDFSLPTSFEQGTAGMHKLKNSKDFECCLKNKAMWKDYFYVLDEEEKTESIQLDHIWYDSKDGVMDLIESYYHTSFCSYTDHIPISASFKIKI